jgi:FMN phosphatase YigB (HAD superfamily)
VNLNDYDALSFDCYGTLIDWEAGLKAVAEDLTRCQRPIFMATDIGGLVACGSQSPEMPEG